MKKYRYIGEASGTLELRVQVADGMTDIRTDSPELQAALEQSGRFEDLTPEPKKKADAPAEGASK